MMDNQYDFSSTGSRDHLLISSKNLLQDCASVSQSMFGNFVGQKRVDQVALLRSNDQVELYKIIEGKLNLVCKYNLSIKVSKMVSVRKPGSDGKDMLVLHIPALKFVTLEFDELLTEFRIYCMHNLENNQRLKETGKLNPKQGFLQAFYINAPPIPDDIVPKVPQEGRGRPRKDRTLQEMRNDERFSEFLYMNGGFGSHTQCAEVSGFIYIADDSKVIYVQFRPQDVEQKSYLYQGLDVNDSITDLIQNMKNSKISSPDQEYLDVYIPQPFSLQEQKISSEDGLEHIIRPNLLPEDIVHPTQIYDLVGDLKREMFGAEDQYASQDQIQASKLDFSPEDLAVLSIRDVKITYPHPSSYMNTQNPNAAAAPQNTQMQEDASKYGCMLNILVLHQRHLEKSNSTRSKVPSMVVNLYQIQPFRTMRNYIKFDKSQAGKIQSVFSHLTLRGFQVSILQQLVNLNYYCSQIIEQPSPMVYDVNNRDYKNDLIYIVSNVSIYTFRQERQKLAEVQTSTIGNIIDHLNEQQRREVKKYNLNEQVPNSATRPNIIAAPVDKEDKRSEELRFDGCTRFIAMPNNRLMIIMENQKKFVVHFRFDQADLDVSRVDFQPIEFLQSPPQSSNRLVPSSLAIAPVLEQPSSIFQTQTPKYTDKYLVFVSSYYLDQHLLHLEPKETVEDEQPPVEKRQRIMSSDSAEIKKLKTQKQQVPEAYMFTSVDWLPTISPITGIMEVGQNKADLLISSGFKTHSMFTLVKNARKGSLSIDKQQLITNFPDLQEVYSLYFEAEQKQYVVLSLSQTTRMLEFTGRLKEIECNSFINDKSSIYWCQIEGNRVVQATKKEIILFGYVDGKHIERQQEFIIGDDQNYVQVVQPLENDTHLICIVRDNNDETILVEYNLQDLTSSQPIFFSNQLPKITKAQKFILDGQEYLAVLQNQSQIIILQLEKSNTGRTWSKVFKSKDHLMNMQSSLLVDEDLEDKFGQRSISDITVKLPDKWLELEVESDTKSMDFHLAINSNQIYLYIVHSDNRISIYESQTQSEHPFLFKLQEIPLQIQTHDIQSDNKIIQEQRQQIFQEGNQVFIFFQNGQSIVVTQRRSTLLYNRLPQEFEGIRSYSKIRIQQKAQRASNLNYYFLCVVGSQLCMGTHAPNQNFDTRQSNLISNGLTLKRYIFENRAIKSFCFHQDKYLVVSTYRKEPTKTAPAQKDIDLGFNPNQNNLAENIRFSLELYSIPSFFYDASQKVNYRELNQQFLNRMLFCTPEDSFKDDELINQLSSLNLNITNAQMMNQKNQMTQGSKDVPSSDDFIAVTTVKLDHIKCEKTWYPSTLQLYQIGENQNLEQVFLHSDKGRIIGCAQGYRGKILSVQHEIPDFQIVTQAIKYNTNDQRMDMSMEKSKFTLDKQNSQDNPQSILNMCKFISVEQDFLLVADIYKNFQIYKLKDQNELKKEFQQDNSQMISLKKRFQSKIDSSCVAIYAFQGVNDKQQLVSLFSASQDGYLRMYNIRGQKELECSAQINIKDNILRVLKQSDSQDPKNYQFLVVPRRGSLIEIKSCTQQKYQVLTQIVEHLQTLVPWKGGVPPSSKQKNMQTTKDMGIKPSFLTGCHRNIRAGYFLNDRFEKEDCNLVVDQTYILPVFTHLSLSIKVQIAKKLGFFDLQELLEIIFQEN